MNGKKSKQTNKQLYQDSPEYTPLTRKGVCNQIILKTTNYLMQEINIKHQVCADDRSRCWGYCVKQGKHNHPSSLGAYILVGTGRGQGGQSSVREKNIRSR